MKRFPQSFKLTRQFDQMDCGPACVRMVADHYGKRYPLSYLRSLSHLNRAGVSVAGIRDALKEIGMKSASYELTIEQLSSQIPLPSILYWNQNHFVVLYTVSEGKHGKNPIFHLADPAFGTQKIDKKELSRHWLNGEKGIAICTAPTSEFYAKNPCSDRHNLIKFVASRVRPFKGTMLKMSLTLLIGALLSLIPPLLTRFMVDTGIGHSDMSVITMVLVAQLAIFLGTSSMEMISGWMTLYLGNRLNVNMLQDYLYKLLQLPMSFFDTKGMGDYSQRINDHNRLRDFITHETVNTSFSFITAVVLLIIIGYFSPMLLFGYLTMTAFSITWMACFWNRKKALDHELFNLTSVNQNKLLEIMGGIADVKVNSFSGYKLQEWNEMQEQLYESNRKLLRIQQIQQGGYLVLGQLRNILITFFMASSVVEGSLTLGMMMSVTAIIGQVNAPLSQLSSFLQRLQEARISLERSEEVSLSSGEDSINQKDLPKEAEIGYSLFNVTFRYVGSIGEAVLKNINLKIPAGKTTAIVGESGSGKTTLMKLLLKFYVPTEGRIIMCGSDLAEYSAESVRRNCGVVMQDSFIFSDTIKRNIIMGKEYVEELFSKSIETACLHDYLNRLPLGAETKIGGDGIGVSGGERQRIMIARAVYHNPLCLIMDEATSSLDAENEQKITEQISRVFKGRTLIVIAHRLSTVRKADNIVVMKHGMVVEQGVHTELVEKKGYYYNLIKNQLELAQG